MGSSDGAVVDSALRGLADELLELIPLGLREPHRPTVVVTEDDLAGIGEVDGWATTLNATQRQDSGFGPGGLVFPTIHGKISTTDTQRGYSQSQEVDKDRLLSKKNYIVLRHNVNASCKIFFELFAPPF